MLQTSPKYIHFFVSYWQVRHLPLIAPASSSSSSTACSLITISSIAMLSISIALSFSVWMVVMVDMDIIDLEVDSPEMLAALWSKINGSCGKSFGGPQLSSEIVPRPPPQITVVATSVQGGSAWWERGAINQEGELLVKGERGGASLTSTLDLVPCWPRNGVEEEGELSTSDLVTMVENEDGPVLSSLVPCWRSYLNGKHI